jgi:MFS transporter, PAT family, beta-lactamase induction signal transducer AmpG
VSTPSIWRVLLSQRMVLCVLTGFTSGLPLYVLYQLVPAWLRDEGVDLATIGLFSLIAFPYTWKFLWSPAMDRFVPPFLGRRRGWALLTQVALLFSLAAFGPLQPGTGTGPIAVVACLVALFSASQDIVLDAYRRELLPDAELGMGNSLFVNAYRIASLVPGSLALILADHLPWSQVHLVVASFMGVGILTTLWMPEPVQHVAPPKSFGEAVIEPFREFFGRRGTRSALLLLAFLLTYKLGDSMATALSTPFYLDLGFTKTQIGTVAKVAALWSSVVGGLVGGVVMIKVGIQRSLWLFGVVQLLSILGFAALAEIGADPTALFFVVSFEYLGVGLGTAAFVAFIARSTDVRYTATQLALLTSLAGVPRTFANATTGFLVEAVGYTQFFLFCTVIAVPGLVLLLWVAPWGPDPVALGSSAVTRPDPRGPASPPRSG